MSRKNEVAARKLDQLAKDIRAMDVRVDVIPPAVGPQIGAMLSRNVRRQFSTKGVYQGTPWKPLKPSTIADKTRKGFPAPNPLVRTTRLKMSLVGRPMGIEKYTRKTMRFGSPLRRAKWQQEGTFRNGRRHIPPRVMLKIGRAERAEMVRIVKKWVVRGKV